MRILGLLTTIVLSTAFTGTCFAAHRMSYEDFVKCFPPGSVALQAKLFEVITSDGRKHSGDGIALDPESVTLFRRDNSSETMFSSEITSIKIRTTGRHFQNKSEGFLFPLIVPAMICMAGSEADIGCGFLLLPAVAVERAVFMGEDVVAFFAKAKVYEIIH